MADQLTNLQPQNIDSRAIAILTLLKECDPWLVGGGVRNLILGKAGLKDLDIVVSNDHFRRAVTALNHKIGAGTKNRHGNPRYFLSETFKLDLFCPSRFFKPFENIDTLLDVFDYSCNAVAFSIEYGFKFRLTSKVDLENRVLRPIDAGWDLASTATDYTHLLGQAVKLVINHNLKPVRKNIFRLGLDRAEPNLLDSRYGMEKHEVTNYLGLN